MKYIPPIIIGISLFFIQSCKKDTNGNTDLTSYQRDNITLAQFLNLPDTPYDYEGITLPSYLDIELISLTDNTPSSNPITNEGATLGRVLFYDVQLSKNNTVSCSSCHIQEFGFSDTASLSVGFQGGKTGRHSMALANARYRTNGKFFWDERAETLEDQVLMPIQDPVEMGMDLIDLELKLSTLPYYPILFARAFGDSKITSDRISKALAQFVRSMVSFSSKYDEGRRNHDVKEPFTNFTTQENTGKSLFISLNKGMCASCHFTDLMVTAVARNNGLAGEKSNDKGVGNHTNNPLDFYKFKAPSLRNIAIRPPYMHNGNFKNLRAVIKAYSTDIQWSPSLDKHLMAPGNQSAIQFNLTDEEIDAIVDFMKTLTDNHFLQDPKYSSPFIE